MTIPFVEMSVGWDLGTSEDDTFVFPVLAAQLQIENLWYHCFQYTAHEMEIRAAAKARAAAQGQTLRSPESRSHK